jgi:hypothetical protein
LALVFDSWLHNGVLVLFLAAVAVSTLLHVRLRAARRIEAAARGNAEEAIGRARCTRPPRRMI